MLKRRNKVETLILEKRYRFSTSTERERERESRWIGTEVLS